MRHVEFESSSTLLLEPFTRFNKSGRDSVRYLGFIQRGNHAAPIFRSAGSRTRLPSTTQYLRRILNSVTSLANTLKTGFVSRTRTCDKGSKSRMLGAPVFPKVTLTSPQRLISCSSIATCSALPGLTVFGFKAYAIVIAISY